MSLYYNTLHCIDPTPAPSPPVRTCFNPFPSHVPCFTSRLAADSAPRPVIGSCFFLLLQGSMNLTCIFLFPPIPITVMVAIYTLWCSYEFLFEVFLYITSKAEKTRQGDTWHDRWYLTHDSWYMMHDKWHGTFQLPSSESFGVKAFCIFWGKGWPTEWINEWVRMVFVEQPWLHWMC